MNTFAQVSWGPLRAQAEYFRAWFEPASGSEIAATGAYGQVAYLPIEMVILGLRYEWFNPDVHEPNAPSLGQWTTAVTYDLPWLPLRLATDYGWPVKEQDRPPCGAFRFSILYTLIGTGHSPVKDIWSDRHSSPISRSASFSILSRMR